MKKINFPTFSDKPFIYTSFVSTIDGKVFVHKPGYWPIGSKEDYARFTFLRAHADIIIDGKNTAIAFGDRTIETIHTDPFLSFRKEIGIQSRAAYGVFTNNPTDLLFSKLKNSHNFKTILITNQNVNSEFVTTTPSKDTLQDTMYDLYTRGYKKIFVDGGPSLIASLIKEQLLDEIFLTISPKTFGSEPGVTQTMVEGKLFAPDAIPEWDIKELEKVGNEIFIQYGKK
jgi:2,5-diamino-6-(ribosylamino)-4(3H)-pyrimidinone 5'-phosphate reductase